MTKNQVVSHSNISSASQVQSFIDFIFITFKHVSISAQEYLLLCYNQLKIQEKERKLKNPVFFEGYSSCRIGLKTEKLREEWKKLKSKIYQQVFVQDMRLAMEEEKSRFS